MRLERILAKVRRAAPLAGELGSPDREAAKRRRSLLFAAELRKHGLLLPENEGAAPGSWWTPGGTKR